MINLLNLGDVRLFYSPFLNITNALDEDLMWLIDHHNDAVNDSEGVYDPTCTHLVVGDYDGMDYFIHSQVKRFDDPSFVGPTIIIDRAANQDFDNFLFDIFPNVSIDSD